MAELELKFIGDLEVIRDGVSLALPPSKKTRALLAFLARNGRAFRREYLCDLLWEVPDDPRGSLRWSLSKLRRLVDGDDRPRIVADRASVRFDVAGADIDMNALETLAQEAERASLADLEAGAERYRGNFLEGLDLSGFHDFHSWCVAERELVTRCQARLLDALVKRLAEQPENALPHARALVGLFPYDEKARAGLIRLLMATGRTEEAEQQYRLGMRMNEEVGSPSSGELFRAWRRAPGAGAAAPAVPPAPASSPANAAPAAREPAAQQTVAGLVGREAETGRLAEVLAEVIREKRAALLLLKGDPGIGKSRLLQVAAAEAQQAGAFVLEASAFESETIRPFALWIDAFRKLGADQEVFGGIDQANRDHLFGVLNDRIQAEFRNRPVALIYDDLQWCDESSAAALHYVVRTNRQQPLIAVLAARDGEVRDNGAVQRMLRGLRHEGLLAELRLGPLGEADVRHLIEAHAPTADVDALSRECGGNPLLAIELARAGSAGDGASSLDELVRERLARFDLEGAEVLRWAAVLAPRVDVASLVRVSGLDWSRVADVLESAERQAMLLSTDGGFRFSHDLVARSIYADISPARRRVMHRRAAELLEQETAVDLEHAADLAHHASHSGDPALAARAMVSAGRLCLRFFANEDAANLARKGLQLVTSLPEAERVCLTLELRDVMFSAAPVEDWETAAAEYVELAERALDHGALSHARLGYHMASYLRWEHGHWAGAREETLQAERVARGGNEADHVVGLAETAKCLAMLERDLSHADAMLMEAQALAARQRTSYHAIPMALGMLRYHENRLEEAEELFKEARTLCKTAGDRVSEFQANEYLVMIDIERGRYDGARLRCRTLGEIGGKLREGSEAPFARALEGLCRYALEDCPEGLAAALEDLRVADAKHRLAYTLTRAAELDIERGRFHDAVARAEEALRCAETLQRATETMLARLALARASGALGDEAAREMHMNAIAALDEAAVARWARARMSAAMAATGGAAP